MLFCCVLGSVSFALVIADYFARIDECYRLAHTSFSPSITSIGILLKDFFCFQCRAADAMSTTEIRCQNSVDTGKDERRRRRYAQWLANAPKPTTSPYKNYPSRNKCRSQQQRADRMEQEEETKGHKCNVDVRS